MERVHFHVVVFLLQKIHRDIFTTTPSRQALVKITAMEEGQRIVEKNAELGGKLDRPVNLCNGRLSRLHASPQISFPKPPHLCTFGFKYFNLFFFFRAGTREVHNKLEKNR